MRLATNDLKGLICAHCDMPFAITMDFFKQAKRSGEIIYCPKGHGQRIEP